MYLRVVFQRDLALTKHQANLKYEQTSLEVTRNNKPRPPVQGIALIVARTSNRKKIF